MDKKGQIGQDTGQEKQQVVYQCPQCNNYTFKTRDAAYKHRQRYGHHIVGLDNGGNIVEEIGKGRPGPKAIAALAAKKPAISGTGDEHVKEHFQGYSKDGESFLFVMHPDGRIRDLRLEQPLLYPIYELMRKERDYKGDFPQFIADAVETLFAGAGYELTLAPKTQGAMYDEVIRLLGEGKLELAYEGEEMRLGVKEDGNKAQRTEGSTSPGSEGTAKLELPQQGGEEEPSEPQ